MLGPSSTKGRRLRNGREGQEVLRRREAISQAPGMSEVLLYPAVERFLEVAGFDVKGEVKGCDIVAI
jgi:hypothetical protein